MEPQENSKICDNSMASDTNGIYNGHKDLSNRTNTKKPKATKKERIFNALIWITSLTIAFLLLISVCFPNLKINYSFFTFAVIMYTALVVFLTSEYYTLLKIERKELDINNITENCKKCNELINNCSCLKHLLNK